MRIFQHITPALLMACVGIGIAIVGLGMGLLSMYAIEEIEGQLSVGAQDLQALSQKMAAGEVILASINREVNQVVDKVCTSFPFLCLPVLVVLPSSAGTFTMGSNSNSKSGSMSGSFTPGSLGITNLTFTLSFIPPLLTDPTSVTLTLQSNAPGTMYVSQSDKNGFTVSVTEVVNAPSTVDPVFHYVVS